MKKVLLLAVPVVSLFFFSFLTIAGCYIYISTQHECAILTDVLIFYKNILSIDGIPSIIINSCLWTLCFTATPYVIWTHLSRKNLFPKLNLYLQKKSFFSNTCMLFSALFSVGLIIQIALNFLVEISMPPLYITHILSINIAAPALFLCIIRDEPSRTKAMISFIGSLVITFVGIPVLALVVFPT